MIFCHGYKGFKDWGAWNLVSEQFLNKGYAFCKFNFSLNGGTIEEPIDFPDLDAFGKNTYSQEVIDIGRVLDHVLIEFKNEIELIKFNNPICPIYQNFTASAVSDPSIIKSNLLSQLTGAVLWTQSVNKMINDGVKEFYEVGPGNILQGLIKKIDNQVVVGKI